MSAALTIAKVLDHPVEPIAIVDCDTLQIVRCNRNFEDYFSFSLPDHLGKDIYEVISFDIPRKRKKEIIETLKLSRIYIDKFTSENDHLFISLVLLEGKEYGLVRISNQRKYSLFDQYRQLFEQNLAGVYKADIEGNILSCNQAFAAIFGYDSAKDMIGINTAQLYKKPELRKDFVKNLRENKSLKNFEIQAIKKDGTLAICLENCYLEKLPSGNETISGTVIDFTEKKEIEFALQERETWFRSLADVSNEGVVFELNDTIVVCNTQFAQMFGFELSGDMVGKRLSNFISPPDLNRIKTNLQISAGNKTEIRLYPNERPLSIEITGSYISYKGARTLALVVSNITERKKAELALERGVVRFRNLLENLPNGVIILTDGQIKYLNHAACTLLGAVDEDEVYDEPFLSFIGPAYRPQVERDLGDVRQGLDAEYTELQMISLNNDLSDVGIKLILTVYENKPSIQVTLSNLHDRNRLADEQMRMRLVEELNTVLKQEIEQHKSTQKQLEEKQQESTEQRAKLEAIFNSTENLMMLTLDKEGNVTANNRNFKNWSEQVLGKSVAIGKNVISFIEDYLDPDLYQGQMKVFQSGFKGKPQQTELPIKDKNGNTLWLQVFLNPVYVGNAFNELSCLAYDNTERKEFEKSVRQSLKEKEVLLKEVHHRVKNNLQIISSMLNLQSDHVNDQATLDVLRESQQRINSMSLIHETIYRNSDFSAIDFTDYISAIASNLVQSYRNPQTQVELIADFDKVLLGLDQSIPCGLIVNELVSNAMKYAFKGKKKGRLCIEVKEKRGNKIELTIKDDGVGLPESWDSKKSGSLGLTLVNALTEQLDGTMVTKSNRGTSHTLSFVRK